MENMLVNSIFSFSQYDFCPSSTKFSFISRNDFVVRKSFQFEQI